MNLVTTHVLDTDAGKPAEGVNVTLEYRNEPAQPGRVICQGRTGADGRLQCKITDSQEAWPGLYSLRFDTSRLSPFFPEILVQFVISDVQQHYHVPLLLTRYGYTIYRGS